MNRAEFEHAIRAAAFHADDELVVIGSQAILASHPDPPDTLVRSMELDVFPLNHPERSDAIDGAMGDGSPFHAAYDFYAHGVGRETLVAPAGSEGRLIRIELPAIRPKGDVVVAWCSRPKTSWCRNWQREDRTTSSSHQTRSGAASSKRSNSCSASSSFRPRTENVRACVWKDSSRRSVDDDCVSGTSTRLESFAVDLYEYQGKELFKRVGIPVSDGRLAETPEEARAAAEEIGGPVVVKAQVLTGGRGKAGGVKLADDPADAEEKARGILGLDINGHIVRRLWIEPASDIAKEYYLSIAFDRGAKKPLFMFTTQGGVEIEQVAEENPDALVRLHVDPLEGFQPWIARRLIYGAGVEDPSEQKQIAAIVEKLYQAFVDSTRCSARSIR